MRGFTVVKLLYSESILSLRPNLIFTHSEPQRTLGNNGSLNTKHGPTQPSYSLRLPQIVSLVFIFFASLYLMMFAKWALTNISTRRLEGDGAR